MNYFILLQCSAVWICSVIPESHQIVRKKTTQQQPRLKDVQGLVVYVDLVEFNSLLAEQGKVVSRMSATATWSLTSLGLGAKANEEK